MRSSDGAKRKTAARISPDAVIAEICSRERGGLVELPKPRGPGMPRHGN
jgi:hypothetical protein